MKRKFPKIIYFLVCFLLIFEQSGFAQVAGQLDISGYFSGLSNSLSLDRFRPLHLRYLSYDNLNNSFNLLLDKGDSKDLKEANLKDSTKELLGYFFTGITLPNHSFWVNLRPDSPNNMIDPYLAQTDLGKILLEADLQLKKDTASFTSPQTREGKQYWDKLYRKAGELFGSENITIPTLTRPWIVPNEIIIRESTDNAYIYKATLKVMLEQDYLKDSSVYSFTDKRLKQLNEYSAQLIRETIIPKLTKDVNTARRYAPLRQVYYSLILAQWFKQKFYGKSGLYSHLINKNNLTGLTSKEPWSKTTYFQAYQKSFKEGEYNIKEPVYTLQGQIIRSYMSGGIALGAEEILRASSVVISSRTGMPQIKYASSAVAASGTMNKPFELDIQGISPLFEQQAKPASSPEKKLQQISASPLTQDEWLKNISQQLTPLNVEHTLRNIRGVEYFVAKERLSDSDKDVLLTALWLHDITKDKSPKDYILEEEKEGLATTFRLLVHHLESAEYAEKFLRERGYDEGYVTEVKEIILQHMGPLKGTFAINNEEFGFMEWARRMNLKKIEETLRVSGLSGERKEVLEKYISELGQGFPEPVLKLAKIGRDIDLLDLIAAGISKVVSLRQRDPAFWRKDTNQPELIRESFNSALESAKSVGLEAYRNLYTDSAKQIAKELLDRLVSFQTFAESHNIFGGIEERRPLKDGLSVEELKALGKLRADEFTSAYNEFIRDNKIIYDDILAGRQSSASSPVEGRKNYNLSASASPDDFIDIVLAKKGVFDREVVDIVQNYIANPEDYPEESGVINIGRLDSLLAVLQRRGSGHSRATGSLKAYLELVRKIKLEENIEIVSYLSPSEMKLITPDDLREYLNKIRKIIVQFPRRLSQQIRIPIQLKFEKLSPGVAGNAGIATQIGVKIDPYYQDLEHVIWHELIHKFSLSSNKEGKPILPTAAWKQIAKSAGFYGALVNGRIVPIDALTDDYKKFREIGYGQWVYQEGAGNYIVYVGRKVFEQIKSNPIFQKNIKLRLYDSGEYWKTTPFEAAAEAGAVYIKDSDTARYKQHDSRFAAVAQILGNTLFVVKFGMDGTVRRYEFFTSDGKKIKEATALSEEEVERIQKQYSDKPAKTLSEVLEELKPETRIRVEKTAILEGKESDAPVGTAEEGILKSGIKQGERLIILKDNGEKFYTSSLADLKLGDEGLEFWTKTSRYKVYIVSRGIAESVSSPVDGNRSQPRVEPKEDIGVISLNNGDKLSVRKGQEENIVSIAFYNKDGEQIGFIDILLRESLLNYIYINPDFRSENYSKVILDTILDKLQDQSFTGRQFTFVTTYVHNPLVVNYLLEKGFLLNPYPMPVEQKLMTEVTFPRSRQINRKIPLYIEDETRRDALKNTLGNEGFEIADKPIEGETYTVMINAKYTLYLTQKSGATQANSASPVYEEEQKTGGIDFRALPITNHPANPLINLRDSPFRGLSLSNINLDESWGQIQNMLKAEIIPSSERIKEYLQACCEKEDMSQETDKVLACIADILRLQEERVVNTDLSLKEMLTLLESDKPANEMQLVLAKITVQAKEPKVIEQ